MKAHIFAGAVRINRDYCSDYVWVTRDEMETILDRKTFHAIRPLLSEH